MKGKAMSTNIERLKKIRELALRGVGGEREQAAALLEELTKKYGVSCEELDEEIVKEYRFKFCGKIERRLLCQVAYKVRNEPGGVYELRYTRSGRTCRNEVAINCTEAQKLEIDFLFDFYKRLWEQDAELFFLAFIQNHRLFGELKEGEEGDTMPREQLRKMYSMMQGMSNETPLHAITAGKK